MTDYRTQIDEYNERALNVLQKGGSADQGFQYVDAIRDEDYRDGTFEKVARFFAAQGQLEKALRFCRATPLQRKAIDIDRKTLVYVANSRLARALSFSAVIELWARHSSATIPLRVSLFLLEIPSAAARTSFS
jgi:hypothetical protein